MKRHRKFKVKQSFNSNIKSNSENNSNSKFKLIFKKYKLLIPFILILALVILLVIQNQTNLSNNTSDQEKTINNNFNDIFKKITTSFDFKDKLKLLTTIILLFTIWGIYKFWLKKIRFIRRNSRLLYKVLVGFMLIIFINNHIIFDSLVGKISEWVLFLVWLYIIIFSAWLFAKIIDRINLRSDLYCWGLRIIGFIFVVIGVTIFFSSIFVVSFNSMILSQRTLMFDHLYWILGVIITLLGGFMGFRSARRYPMLRIWH